MPKTVDLGLVRGSAGPQGPKGDTGPQGERGPQGLPMTEKVFDISLPSGSWLNYGNGMYWQMWSSSESLPEGTYELMRHQFDTSATVSDLKNYAKAFSIIANGIVNVDTAANRVYFYVTKIPASDVPVTILWRGNQT